MTLHLKYQADKALRFPGFCFTQFSVELIKDFIGDKFIICPYRLDIRKILHKALCFRIFPCETSIKVECFLGCEGNFVVHFLPSEHCSIVRS